MYELADPTAEADLAADAARGVDVRVLLDQHLEKSRNTGAYDYLAAHGVHVRWAPAGTTYHQKTLTVDDATSVIMTLNLVAEDYSGTRDFAVIDTGRADVAAIVATFNADFAGRAITPPDGTDLVWSPTNAQGSVLSVINGATHTLAVEDEEMDDPAVTGALAAAARRGVNVTITMTADPEWDQAFTELARPARTSGSTPTTAAPCTSTPRRSSPTPAARPAGAGRIAELLRRQPRLQPGTRHPHPRPGRGGSLSATLASDYAGATAYSPAARPGRPGQRLRRLVHRHRERLQRLRRREQRLRALQPARPGRHRDRRRLLAHLPDQRLRLRADLPQRPPAWRPDHRDRRRRHLHHQRLNSRTYGHARVRADAGDGAAVRAGIGGLGSGGPSVSSCGGIYTRAALRLGRSGDDPVRLTAEVSR